MCEILKVLQYIVRNSTDKRCSSDLNQSESILPRANLLHLCFVLGAKGWTKVQELFVHRHFKATAFTTCTGTWSINLPDMVNL
jgi:hypothetical protein